MPEKLSPKKEVKEVSNDAMNAHPGVPADYRTMIA